MAKTAADLEALIREWAESAAAPLREEGVEVDLSTGRLPAEWMRTLVDIPEGQSPYARRIAERIFNSLHDLSRVLETVRFESPAQREDAIYRLVAAGAMVGAQDAFMALVKQDVIRSATRKMVDRASRSERLKHTNNAASEWHAAAIASFHRRLASEPKLKKEAAYAAIAEELNRPAAAVKKVIQRAAN